MWIDAVRVMQAGLHEVVSMIYDILSPIYNQQKDYKKLSDVHNKLSDSFAKISSQVQHSYTRMLVIMCLPDFIFEFFLLLFQSVYTQRQRHLS